MAQINKLTDQQIKKLKAEEKDQWVRDGDGLVLRVYPTGAKIWHYIFTNPDGKKRYQRLGAYPDISLAEARELRNESRKKVSKGKDPIAEIQREKIEYRNAETVRELVDDYIENYAKIRKKTWREYDRILRKDIVPLWGLRKAKEITRRDVKELLRLLQPRGTVITINTYKIVRKMFKHAVSEEIIVKSPCDGLTQKNDIPTAPSRERVLDADEIKTAR